MKAARHAMRSALVRSFGHFCRARMTEHLVTWCGVHITKVHVYMTVAGLMCLLDFARGHGEYGLLVLVLAALDLMGDIKR